MKLLVEDPFANINATVADIDTGPGNKLFDLGMALSAERTHREIGRAGHGLVFLLNWRESKHFDKR
jgi:hypothetical protein